MLCSSLSLLFVGRLTHSPKSRLFLTSKREDKFFHIFEARITSELLGVLDNPSTATTHIDWPTIKHKRAPFHPVEGLKERLHAEIALDQPPGTFDPSDPVDPDLLWGETRKYQDDEDIIHVQRRKEVKKKTKKKVKKRIVRHSEGEFL